LRIEATPALLPEAEKKENGKKYPISVLTKQAPSKAEEASEQPIV